jgi:hypothetical protein
MAKAYLRLPSRIGFINIGNGEKQNFRDSTWAVAYGLCILGTHSDEEEVINTNSQFLVKIWKGIVSWLKQFLP